MAGVPDDYGCTKNGNKHDWNYLGDVGDGVYLCKKCRLLVQSTEILSPYSCPKANGGDHEWHKLGEVGDENYQCDKCGIIVQTSDYPNEKGCPKGGKHDWNTMDDDEEEEEDEVDEDEEVDEEEEVVEEEYEEEYEEEEVKVKKIYQCKYCGIVIQSFHYPNPEGCQNSSTHNWYNLGDVGDKNYQCKYCGLVVQSSHYPYRYCCPNEVLGSHTWYEL
jgi:DNA-directed RNA polymerase subunit RPC12/RpoP